MDNKQIATIRLLFDILKKKINPSLDNKLYQEWAKFTPKQKKNYPFRSYIIDRIEEDVIKVIEKGS